MLNCRLLNFRKRSFYMDQLLIADSIVIFFQLIDLRWFSLSIGDGTLCIQEETQVPEYLSLDDMDDPFAYPIEDLAELDNFKQSTLNEVYEYRLKDNLDFCIGIFLKLDKGNFSIIDNNGNLSIIVGIDEDLLAQCELIPMPNSCAK